MFQKISERHAWIVTRTLIISQGRRTVINLMTSNKKCHTDLSFMLLGPSTLFTSGGSTKGTQNRRDQNIQSTQLLSRLLPLFSPRNYNFKVVMNISKESVLDVPVTTLSTSATSHW